MTAPCGGSSRRPARRSYARCSTPTISRSVRKTDPDDPLGPLAHQLRVFLIDAKGDIRNIYSVGFLDPRLVMTDVRTLLAEERAPPTAF